MNSTAKTAAAHFKVSVTGDTVFFFSVWPWLTPRVGYVVPSEEDVEALKSRLASYYRWTVWIAVAAGPLMAAALAGLGIIEDDPFGGVVFAVAMALLTSLVGAAVFMRFVVHPMVRNYRTAHPMMEYLDAEETPTGWRRWVPVAALLAMAAYGLWLWSSGETTTGLVFLAVGIALLVWYVCAERAASRKRAGAGYASNPRL